MTDDVAAFIAARLGEDEAAANRAARKRRGPWRVLGDGLRAIVHGSRGPDLPVADTPGTDIAAHIARHDPARVLREVAAKRAILAETERALADDLADQTAQDRLRILAAIWSDHPDYRAEWRP